MSLFSRIGNYLKHEEEAIVDNSLKIELLEVMNLDMSPTDVLWPISYVTVTLRDKELFRTHKKEHGLSQLYNESFEIEFNVNDTLIFEVWEYHKVSFDRSASKFELPLGCISLEEKVPKTKCYYLPHQTQAHILLKFTSNAMKLNDEATKEREIKFDEDCRKVRYDYNQSLVAKRKEHKMVTEFFDKLDKIVHKSNKVEEVADKLAILIKEVTIFLELSQKDVLANTVRYIKDHMETDVYNEHFLKNPVLDCLGDIIHAYAESLILLGKTSEAMDAMVNYEALGHHEGVHKLMDELEIANISGQRYTFLNGQRIHIPSDYTGDGWPTHLDKAIPAVFFSWVVYEHRPRWMFGRIWNSNIDARLEGYGDWKISTQFHIDRYALNFHAVFAVNEELGTVVLAIRGTEVDFKERFTEVAKGWFANLNVTKISFPIGEGVEVHKGYYDQYLSIKDEVTEQISMYLKRKYRIIMTGHSQGAGLCTMVASHMGYLFGDLGSDNIKVITFGSPRVGNKHFATLFDKMYPNTRRYVAQYNGDVVDTVSRVPLENMGFYHVGTEIFIPSDNLWYGNPQPIPGISIQTDVKGIPDQFLIHGQQVYCDGLIRLLSKK